MDPLNPELISEFEGAFGRKAEYVASAGGRVNIIGEHTDYHEGYVLPAAIDLRTWALGAPRQDGMLRIRSVRVRSEVVVDMAQLGPLQEVGWQAYVLGPFWALRESGHRVSGADVLVDSDVPFGGGLSSSASVQVALAGLGAAIHGVRLQPLDVARIARRAENEFCRVPCGIMDQIASACGQSGHAIMLDCRSVDMEMVPIPTQWALIVADSGVKHSLGTSEYAKRQSECAAGLQEIRVQHPELRSLRDVTPSILGQWEKRIPEPILMRLRHVVSENERVLRARTALRNADAGAMGRLLYASHDSLTRDYEVSCAELNTLVEIAASVPGVIGARLTGAGFGGNTVNLVHVKDAEACREAIEKGYASRTGKSTSVRIVRPANGLHVVSL